MTGASEIPNKHSSTKGGTAIPHRPMLRIWTVYPCRYHGAEFYRLFSQKATLTENTFADIIKLVHFLLTFYHHKIMIRAIKSPQTAEVRVKTTMRAQRVRGAGSRAEMQMVTMGH